ncbi:hypothetical protein Hanom_Chr01g00006821 [Helianthus anomalus]
MLGLSNRTSSFYLLSKFINQRKVVLHWPVLGFGSKPAFKKQSYSLMKPNPMANQTYQLLGKLKIAFSLTQIFYE